MNANDLSQWLLVILRKESYVCGDYEVHDTHATMEQVQQMFHGLPFTAQTMRYEKLISKVFEPEAHKQTMRTNVEDPNGDIEIILLDGRLLRLRALVNHTYGWTPPQETAEYAEWAKDGIDGFEELPRFRLYLSGEMAKHLTQESAPPSVRVYKSLRYEGVFVSIGDVSALLRILRRYEGEIEMEYWDYYHEGHGKRSENPIPVTALIVEADNEAE